MLKKKKKYKKILQNMFWRQWSTNSSNPEACSEANCRFKAVFLIYFELTWLPWSIRTRSKFWCGWRRFWWHVLRVAAQPLLLFAQRDHFAAKLLVWRPAYKSTIHILGFDVGLDLVPVSEPEKHFIYEWSENESWPSVSHKYNLLGNKIGYKGNFLVWNYKHALL